MNRGVCRVLRKYYLRTGCFVDWLHGSLQEDSRFSEVHQLHLPTYPSYDPSPSHSTAHISSTRLIGGDVSSLFSQSHRACASRQSGWCTTTNWLRWDLKCYALLKSVLLHFFYHIPFKTSVFHSRSFHGITSTTITCTKHIAVYVGVNELARRVCFCSMNFMYKIKVLIKRRNFSTNTNLGYVNFTGGCE